MKSLKSSHKTAITLFAAFSLLWPQNPLRADVLPQNPDDRYVIQVTEDSVTQKIHFELCDLVDSDLEPFVNCRPIGNVDGYTLQSLEDQRIIERNQTIGTSAVAVVTTVLAAWTGFGLSGWVAANSSNMTGWTGTAVTIGGTLGGGGVVGGIELAIGATNPFNQYKDQKILGSDIVSDQDTHLSGGTVYEYAQRLERMLAKIDKK